MSKSAGSRLLVNYWFSFLWKSQSLMRGRFVQAHHFSHLFSFFKSVLLTNPQETAPACWK